MAETTTPLTPAQASARRHLQHGMQYLEAGDLQAAGNALLQAVRLDDTLALAHYQLGNCLRRYGDHARAEQALLAAIEQDATLNDAYISLAYLYHESGRGHDAGLILEKLRATRPENVDLRFQLGGLLVKFGLFADAERIFADCPPSDARHAQAQLTLGNAYQAAGKFERAQQAFLKAIELNADSDAAYLRLAHTRRFGAGDAPTAEKFEQILAQADLSPATQVCLHFSLGKIYDDMACYDQAFEHYRRGNELQHARVQFDRTQLLDYIARAKQVFTAGFLRSAVAATASATPQPIFVVGMLRSGTTLVERILASHPGCYGLGETELVDALTRDMAAQAGKDYLECARTLTPALCTRHATALRAAWPAPARRLAHVIDKNPLNFLHLGLISLLFPGAPIMHCVRDPLDTCLSIYFQHFAHPRNTYAYALDDIAFFYRQYRDMMAYWRQALLAPPYEVRYEELVREPERETRALVSAAGLTWDPACLESHKHTERIDTASAWQARQPIYSASAGRWHRYAHHLDDLRKALGTG
ncbi:MAG TPA: sulfotransferase [Gammaproteobacteria bacterium]|nr:sulfotransferase [Gammaproteobacteria bacterium]